MRDLVLITDPRGQVYAGLQYILWKNLRLYLPDAMAVREANRSPLLVPELSESYTPIISLALGRSAPMRGTRGGNTTRERITNTEQGRQIVLTEVVNYRTPLVVTISAAGVHGETDAARMAAFVLDVLSDGVQIPLPDTLDDEETANADFSRFGLSATLTLEGEDEDSKEASSGVHHYNVYYYVDHSRFSATEYPTIKRVDVAVAVGQFLRTS